MGSKLLSGGFSNRHLGLFNQKSIDAITQVCTISGDSEMQAAIKIYNDATEEKKTSVADEEESVLASVIHEGRDRKTDICIAFLQKALINPRRRVGGKMAMVPHARVGGADAMALCRAAFAVMLKFSGAMNAFNDIRDEIDFVIESNEDAPLEDQLKAFEEA